MKKIVTLLVIFLLLLLMAACSQGDNEEEILENTLQSSQDVYQYAADFDMRIYVETSDQSQTSNNSAQAEIILSEDPVASYQHLTQEEDGAEKTTTAYRIDNEAYVQDDGGSWRKVDVMEEETMFEPSYPEIVSILEAVEDYAVFDSSDSAYTYTYSGFDREVYDAFETPFNVELTGFDIDEDVSLDFTMHVNETEHYIENMEYNIYAENNMGNLEMNFQITYEDINDIDPIEFPEEAIEETAGNAVDLPDINQYAVDFKMHADVETEVESDRSILEGEAIVSNEDRAAYQLTTTGQNDEEMTKEFYQTGEKAYAQDENDNWVETDVEEKDALFEPSYQEVAAAVESVIPYAEKKEETEFKTYSYLSFFCA
ncbi:DUF6612 family protein [Oceanobacillus jeddahense]|uniref:Uncharacterized protein n=1 Tax=Oceanobacillus jeddahense TaxID=1462527 RepID=A0ABY5JSM5_9BACI|nr:DUF6612 family protein [Oceanobacillus jeddahense]UUI03332.1 hypothetical protein NP439_01020 [Oceanobacillus jeddahense]